jgi:Tol biopolymer transport system component
LSVADADGKNPQDVAKDHVLAFQWSPNGQRIAFLTVTTAGSSSRRFSGLAQAGGQDLRLQWQVLDLATGKVSNAATFLPTDNLMNMLPYFDQYSRSMTFWSPDSQRLVYAAQEPDGSSSIYVATVDGANPPQKISGGVIACWSWK